MAKKNLLVKTSPGVAYFGGKSGVKLIQGSNKVSETDLELLRSFKVFVNGEAAGEYELAEEVKEERGFVFDKDEAGEEIVTEIEPVETGGKKKK